MDDTKIIREEIASRKRTYESSKSRGLRSLRRGNLNDALYWFYAAARVLGYFHFGLWMDTVLEEALWQIANRIDSTNGRVVPVSIRKKQVVHLASYLMDYGGHSEMILNWSRSLAGLGSPDQYFLSSELPQARCTSLDLAPHKLMELTRSSTDCRLCPQKLQPFPRARWLFNELQNIRPDVVILHVHPEDVFSFCAARAAQTRLGSRIVYFNMADHLPNIGMAWTDYVADVRTEGARYTRWLRHVSHDKIVRVPLWSRSRNSARVTRSGLGIPDNATVSTTVTTYYKIRPDRYWDFGKVIYDLLAGEPTHYHLVVGAGDESDRKSVVERFTAGSTDISRRLIWLGQRSDVDAILGISDFLIESFPIAGAVVRLDALVCGVPVIGIRNLQWPLMSDAADFPDNYPFVGTCNEDIVRFSKVLIAGKELRDSWSKNLLDHYQQHYSQDNLLRALGNLLTDKPSPGFPSDLQPPVFDAEYAVPLIMGPFLNDEVLRQNIDSVLGYSPRTIKGVMAAARSNVRRKARGAVTRMWRALPLSNEARQRVKAFLRP